MITILFTIIIQFFLIIRPFKAHMITIIITIIIQFFLIILINFY